MRFYEEEKTDAYLSKGKGGYDDFFAFPIDGGEKAGSLNDAEAKYYVSRSENRAFGEKKTKLAAVANGKMLAIGESRTYFGKCDYGRGHNSLIADFYSCVSRGEKFWINGEEGAKVVKLILAVYESNGKEVKIGEA